MPDMKNVHTEEMLRSFCRKFCDKFLHANINYGYSLLMSTLVVCFYGEIRKKCRRILIK